MTTTQQYSYTGDADDLPTALENAAEWLKTMRNTFGNLHVEKSVMFCEGDYWLVEIILATEPLLKEREELIHAS